MEFKDFLIKEYLVGEKSAQDYVGRFNGIVARGIYNGGNEFTSGMQVAIEREYPDSKAHYLLTLERYIELQQKKG